MNSKILVIEHASTSISVMLDCQKLEYFNQSKDIDIHRWLIFNKQILSNAEKLIITVRLGDEDAEYTGLYVGMHIRLSKELEQVRLLPIVFVSDDTKEEILSNQIINHKEKSGLLLFTKGTYLMSAFSLDKFVSKTISTIDEKILIETIIPTLNIENSKDPGHQLANDWGAFRLAKFAGYLLKLEKPSSLYFKYKDSFTNNEIVPETNTNIGFFKESFKALLVDDNADSGWSAILEFILKKKIVMNGSKASLDVIKTFNEAMEFNDYIKYDLIFLDLRLLKEEDKPNHVNNINDFSGTIVLKKIKEVNQGIQVVIFTASNKVWNIHKLIDIGANGYYIKESPEYTLSDDFSKENYKELLATIEKLLKNNFLKSVCEIRKKCVTSMKSQSSLKSVSYKQFFDRTETAFEISLELMGKISENPKYLNLAFLTLFQIIEDYVNQIENFEYISKKECYVGLSRIKCIDDSSGDLIWKLSFQQDKFDGDYFEISDEIKTKEEQIMTLAKVSFVLAFIFHKDNFYLRKWAKLNNIRNTKAGHGGSSSSVTIANINELLEIIELILI